MKNTGQSHGEIIEAARAYGDVEAHVIGPVHHAPASNVG